MRSLQISECRGVPAGRRGAEGSQTGSARKRREAHGCLQPAGDWDESNRSHSCRRSVSNALCNCVFKCIGPRGALIIYVGVVRGILFSFFSSVSHYG